MEGKQSETGAMGRKGSRGWSGKQRQAGWTIKRTGRKTVEERWLSKSFSSPGAARISPVVVEGATIFSRKGRNEKRERGGGDENKRRLER